MIALHFQYLTKFQSNQEHLIYADFNTTPINNHKNYSALDNLNKKVLNDLVDSNPKHSLIHKQKYIFMANLHLEYSEQSYQPNITKNSNLFPHKNLQNFSQAVQLYP